MMMKEVVRELKERIGVRGVLVMTLDGVVAVADLCDELDAESVAALASASVGTVVDAARQLDLGETRRITLSASLGRLVFVPFDELILVVVTEPNLSLDRTMLEIAGPARRIQQLATQW